MDDAIVVVGDVVWKCLVGEERSLIEEREEVKQEGRVFKAVYACGVRLVKALRNVDVEAID